MTWREEANAHWDKIRERIRTNPTIIKPQKLAHEIVAELQIKNANLRAERDAAINALKPFALVGIDVLKNRPGWANATFSGAWAGNYKLTYAQFEAAAAAVIATDQTGGAT